MTMIERAALWEILWRGLAFAWVTSAVIYTEAVSDVWFAYPMKALACTVGAFFWWAAENARDERREHLRSLVQGDSQ